MTRTVVGLDTYDANVTDVFDQQLYLMAHDDVDAAASAEAIGRVLDGWPNAELQDQAGFK